MTTGSLHVEYRRLRAPQEDRALFADPPLDGVSGLVEANLARRSQYCYDLQGRCLSEVARESRRQLLAAARRWTSQYRDVPAEPADPSAPIFLAGHQPQLFHPGVWLKNFAMAALARRHGGTGVNLIIDSDTLKRASLRVPGGSVAGPQVAEIPLDEPGPAVPYEERRVRNRQVFADVGGRAAEQIAPLVADPLIRGYWPMAVRRSGETDNLGACLAQSRHQLEGRWGFQTLEIPQSRVCGMEPHAWLVAHLLAQLPRLRTIYNEVVEEYRRVNRIRSSAHPVPNLASDGPWLEAPFWIWTADDPRRRRLFARHGHGEVVLSDRQAQQIVLPLSPDGDAARAVERLGELGRKGVKIRCRALITTLWARLALGDLFLHGIGGAKYDQVTDALICRFFGLQPPGFLVLSATLHLPIPRQRAAVEDARAIQHKLRELTYHPECYIDGAGGVSSGRREHVAKLVAAKRHWIRTEQTPENARTRYQQIRRINEALQPCVAPLREELLEQRGRTARALRAEAVLSCREYAFCLYPEKSLQEFLLRPLHKSDQIGFDNR